MFIANQPVEIWTYVDPINIIGSLTTVYINAFVLALDSPLTRNSLTITFTKYPMVDAIQRP